MEEEEYDDEEEEDFSENDEEELTESDLLEIQDMMNFGFTYDQCVEAYMVCDKNKEMAINFLFDQNN